MSSTAKVQPGGDIEGAAPTKQAPAPQQQGGGGGLFSTVVLGVLLVLTLAVAIATLGVAAANYDYAKDQWGALQQQSTSAMGLSVAEAGGALQGNNPCAGKKPQHADANQTDNYFANVECLIDGVLQTAEQAGANVTAGYVGGIETGDREPIVEPYWKMGLCPVNVHWHLGAEHLSVGEYDYEGMGPGHFDDEDAFSDDGVYSKRKLLAEGVREGLQCHLYDPADARFTTEYEWEHCVGMHVGKTYEVHWPHSAAGACGTPNQYQTPFYDGVFCMDGIITLDPLNTFEKIGVQAQVYTIVNDEAYYYPNLMRGMIVDGDFGADVAKYTGSTTGTSRDNEICSRYTPITWQVDRKCHLISASSFDKMCADMKAQRDDMSDDLHAHGARKVVSDELAANNLQK